MAQKFAAMLKRHQLATLSDGSTVLERSLIEHNCHAASRIYDNIYIKELARLLNVSAEKAEEVASRMIESGSIDGTIDRIEGIISFNQRMDTFFGSLVLNPVESSILSWDNGIKLLQGALRVVYWIAGRGGALREDRPCRSA